MYAVIEMGSRQYNVKEKDIINVEKQPYKEGKEFDFSKILLVKDGKSVVIGQPYVKEYKVIAKLIRHIKGRKVTSYKYIRREDSRWKKGHRQNLSLVQIIKISATKEAKEEKKEAPKSKEKT